MNKELIAVVFGYGYPTKLYFLNDLVDKAKRGLIDEDLMVELYEPETLVVVDSNLMISDII